MPSCCGRTFSHNGMRNHLDNSACHADEIECEFCFRRFPWHAEGAKSQHEQNAHWLQCNQCSYSFKYQDDLDNHMDNEHPRPYCESCQRNFSSENALNMHLKSSVHVGKNVKCPWCSLRFTNLTGVCLHLESGRCSSGIDRAKIDKYCNEVDPQRVFTKKQIGWYNDDDNQVENIATENSYDGNWYRCMICDKGFSTLHGLNQHLGSPVHRAKIYHCPRCQREYTNLSGLINHLESESCGQFRFQRSANGGLSFVNQLKLGN